MANALPQIATEFRVEVGSCPTEYAVNYSCSAFVQFFLLRIGFVGNPR